MLTAPTVDTFTADPPSPIAIGQIVSLVATASDADPGDQITSFSFYEDVNGNGAADDDELLYTDLDGEGGWTTDWNTRLHVAGPVTLLAVAFDLDKTPSLPRSLAVTLNLPVANQPPAVDAFQADSLSVVVGEILFLTAAASDPDAGDAVSEVRFYEDKNLNSVPEEGELLYEDLDDSDGWSFDWNTTSHSAGRVSLLAVAEDRSKTASLPRATTVSIASRIGGRHIFYNNSIFDGYNVGVDAADDAAIATDKQALLTTGAASNVNVTNYSKGINGIIVDLAGLPTSSEPTTADFAFKGGTSADPASWTSAPQPAGVTVRRGAGTSGADRIFLTWPDGSIRNAWLQVTLKANALTGLTQPEVFYFGNLVGEAGDPRTPLRVSAQDLVAARRAISSRPVPITNVDDVNRDGRVNVMDYAATRANVFRTLGPIVDQPAMGALADRSEPRRAVGTRRSLWSNESTQALLE